MRNAPMPTAEDAPRPCPRCGHDLRGIAESWRTACPLDGRCPECGLGFRWGDLLRGRLNFPWWCIEGAPGPIPWLGRFAPTFLMATLLPRRLLRQLRIEHGWRPVRLLGAAVAVLLLGGLAAMLLPTLHYVQNGMSPDRAMLQAAQLWNAQRRQVMVPIPEWTGDRLAFVSVDPTGRVSARIRTQWQFDRLLSPPQDAMQPDGSILLPDFGVTGVLLPAAGGRLVVVPVDLTFEVEDGPPRPAVRESVPVTRLHPDPDFTRFVWPVPPGLPRDGRVELKDPAGVVSAAVVQQVAGLRRAVQTFPPSMQILERGVGRAWRWLEFWWMPTALALIGAAPAFLLLPIVVRRARVRPRHLVRLAAYASLGVAGIAIAGGAVSETAGLTVDAAALSSRLGLMELAVLLGLPSDEGTLLLHLGRWVVIPMIVAGTWWTWAARFHLRMERPVMVGWSVAALATLAATVAMQVARGII